MRTQRLARRLGLDGNPLRRRIEAVSMLIEREPEKGFASTA